MKRWWPLIVAALPGVALIGAGLVGFSIGLRDVPSFFVPLRHRTAAVLQAERQPFWNPDNGCGEPFFANPQANLLYPPAWFALLMPAPRAVTCEAGFHLGVLGIGCALLALRMGAKPAMAAAAGVAAAVAGPTIDAVGVLNNLDTLAWTPWVWWAARCGSLPGIAGFLALAFLGAEPQLTVVAGLVAVALAPSRRTVAGVALAIGLVSVQAVPFAAWVRNGDRGAAMEVAEVCAGAVTPSELPAFAVPGYRLPSRPDRYVPHPLTPAWVLLLGGVALCTRRREVRVLAATGFVLVMLSVLPAIPGGREVWAAVTGGFVRYPGRLVFPAVVALSVAAAAAHRPSRRMTVAVAATGSGLLIGLAVVSGSPLLLAAVQAGTACAALVPGFGGVAALCGAAALGPDHAIALRLSRAGRGDCGCLAAQRAGGLRVFAVQPSWDQLDWIAAGGAERSCLLGFGYWNLIDGRTLVRSYAPVRAAALAGHLEQADKGPAGRWWLDAMAAARVVSHHPVQGFPVVCRHDGAFVLANPQAWPVAQLVVRIPAPDEQPEPTGRIVWTDEQDDVRRLRLEAGPRGGRLLFATVPDPGWRWRIGGEPATVERGPGILHAIRVPPGDHWVEGRYRPPGLAAGSLLSVASLVILGLVAWRKR